MRLVGVIAIDQAAGQILAGDFISMYTLNSGAVNQRWIPMPTSSGYFRLMSANTGLILQVNGSSTANAARIDQQEWFNYLGQQWKMDTP